MTAITLKLLRRAPSNISTCNYSAKGSIVGYNVADDFIGKD
jgi:hypothetical protein